MLDKAKLVGKELCQGKNDYKTGGIFYGLFLAPKKHCLTTFNYGIIEEHKIFKRFNDIKRLLDRSQFFKMMVVEKIFVCCLKVGKDRLITELLYQQKRDFVLNVV